jgi:hypothetical protein
MSMPGVTFLTRAIGEFGPLNIIFVGGAWHGYTREAKEECADRKIGLYYASGAKRCFMEK